MVLPHQARPGADFGCGETAVLWMGKRMIAALLSCAILVSLAGCGQKPKEPEMVTSSGVLELRENSPSEERL